MATGRRRFDSSASVPADQFAGTRTGADLAAHYASADLFLFGSLTETYGNVVAEAMASGLPVVAYRSAASAELVVDGFSGRSVAPGDADAFVTAALGRRWTTRYARTSGDRHALTWRRGVGRRWSSASNGCYGRRRFPLDSAH
ncbi:MAG: glycosyltransferase [Rhodocyclaceae bacterium]|nr:glycosyltransferase [Rhodocyclaceae bacterium]